MGYFVSRDFSFEPGYLGAPEVVMAPWSRPPAVELFIDVGVAVGVLKFLFQIFH